MVIASEKIYMVSSIGIFQKKIHPPPPTDGIIFWTPRPPPHLSGFPKSLDLLFHLDIQGERPSSRLGFHKFLEVAILIYSQYGRLSVHLGMVKTCVETAHFCWNWFKILDAAYLRAHCFLQPPHLQGFIQDKTDRLLHIRKKTAVYHPRK